MGKFNMQDDRNCLKELACRKKEKTLAKNKAQGSNLKRKGADDSRVKKSTSHKKSRTSIEEIGVELAGKKSTSELVVSVSDKDKGKEIVQGMGKTSKSSSDSINLKLFIDDVVQAFSQSISEKLSSPKTDSQKFRLSFNKLAMFESIEGPLREHIADLVQKLADAEEDLESVNMVIKKRDESLVRLEVLKKEAKEVIEVLSTDMVVAQKKNEVEIEKFHNRIVGLQEKVDQLHEENETLKQGEGFDLEAVIDSAEFMEIKDCMEDAVGDELIRRINTAHSEWDLSFLTDGRIKPKPLGVNQDDGVAGGKEHAVNTIEGSETGVDPNEEGGSV